MSEWLPVPGFRRYCVNEMGEVRGRGGRILKTHKARGYLVIGAWSDDGKRVKKGVHQLVALAFHGEPPSPQHEAAHWDGVRTNNAASNIRWATGAENFLDKVRHMTHRPTPKGGRHPILVVEQVEDIRRRYTGQPGQAAEMAAEFGVGRTTIRRIARGQSWTTVPFISDRDRLDWILRNVSGAEWRRLGIVYSGGCTKEDVDVAIRASEATRPEASAHQPAKDQP